MGDSGNRNGEGMKFQKLANFYNSSGEYDKAIECLKKSLDIFKEIGDKESEGISYGELGNTYQSLGDFPTAIQYHEKSLTIAQELDDRAGQVACYVDLGNDYGSIGDFHKVIEYSEMAIAIAKEIGCRKSEGIAYGNLANGYMSLGEYRKAIEYIEESLSIAQETGNRRGEGNTLECMGNTYHLLGENLKAIEYYEKSLRIAKEVFNRDGEASNYGRLGNMYHSMEEYRKSIEYYENGLSIAEEIGRKDIEGGIYGNLGTAYESIGNYHKAIECSEKGICISREVGNKAAEGRIYEHLGLAHASLEEYHKAMECQEKALSIAREIEDRIGESASQCNIGVLFSSECSLKNLGKAEENFQSGIECSEKLFDELKEKDQFKISFVDTYVKNYKLLSKVQLETKQQEKALLTCERGRARALRDLLSLKYNTNEKPPSKQIESLKLDDVKIISSRCDACILFYDIDPNKLTARLWVISSQSDSIDVYDEMAEHEALEKIVSNLPKDETQNIKNGYFHHLVDNSYHHMNIRDAVKCEDRSLESLQCEEDMGPAPSYTSSEPNETASSLFRELTRWVVDVDEDDDMSLEVLFQRLVTPKLDKLTTGEIVIIPDGPLFMVPFAALRDPETGKYLSETKRLRLAPSLTTLKILQESSDDRHYKSGALIIGDPAVGEVMYRGNIKRDIHPLPGARDEATEIGKLLGVEPLLGEKASKEAVLCKLQHGVSVIHFAAHGSSQNGQIFLAPSHRSSTSAVPEENDYILTMKDAQESGIRAQLVVLSCCHSGRGDIKSEGVVGMTRAFLAAGARAVVASLWAIDDLATKFFMLKFYSHLKNGESASSSLQQAMKEMRETEEYKDPKYWAAFFLIGDDVTITV